MMTHRERIAADLARRRKLKFSDYAYKPGHVADAYDALDRLHTIEDDGLRKSAWDLYWLLEAERVEHNYRLPELEDDSERKYP